MNGEVGLGHVEVGDGVLLLVVVLGVTNGLEQDLFVLTVDVPHEQLVQFVLRDEDRFFLFFPPDLGPRLGRGAKGKKEQHGRRSEPGGACERLNHGLKVLQWSETQTVPKIQDDETRTR